MALDTMASQPIPNVSASDVERIIRRDFSANQVPHVLQALAACAPDSAKPHRVQLACLKLAGGNLDLLKQMVDVAIGDYRDVLSSAEYPRYLKEVAFSSKVPSKERQAIIDSDWEQYQNWLAG
jgi:hypothetical protein